MATDPRMATLARELPATQREALLRGVLGGAQGGILPAQHAREVLRQEPIGVSVDDEIAGLIRKFPGLKPVFRPYRKHREKRIRDLQLGGPERDRLLYQILAIKKANKRKSSGRRSDRIRARDAKTTATL